MTETMQQTKGDAYVAAWPNMIADQHRLSSAYVIRALNTVTGSTVDEYDARVGEQPIPEIGALTADAAAAVLAELTAARAGRRRRAATCCHYCGLPLRGRECDECGAPPAALRDLFEN